MLQDAQSSMRVLDADPQNATATINLRRGFHTLKGSSRMVGLMAFGEAAWAIEDTLNGHLADQVPASSDLRALIDYAIRYLSGWLDELQATGHSSRTPDTLVDAARAVRAGASPDMTAFAATEIIEPAPAPDEAEAADESFVDTLFAPMTGTELNARAYAATEVIEQDDDAELRFFGEQPQHPAAEPTVFATAAEEPATAPAMFASADGATPPAVPPAPADETSFDWFDLPDATSDAPTDTATAAPVDDRIADEPAASDEFFAAVNDEATETAESSLDDEVEPSARPFDNVVPFVLRDPLLASDEVRRVGPLTVSVALFNIYLTEADELLRVLTTDLAEWRHEPDRLVSDGAVRAVHSLSGSSATVGLTPAQDLASAIEEVLVALYRDPVPLTGDQVGVMQDAVESLRRMLHRFAAERMPEPDPVAIASLIALRRQVSSPADAASTIEATPVDEPFDAFDFGDDVPQPTVEAPVDEPVVSVTSDEAADRSDAGADAHDFDAITTVGATETPFAPFPANDDADGLAFEPLSFDDEDRPATAGPQETVDEAPLPALDAEALDGPGHATADEPRVEGLVGVSFGDETLTDYAVGEPIDDETVAEPVAVPADHAVIQPPGAASSDEAVTAGPVPVPADDAVAQRPVASSTDDAVVEEPADETAAEAPFDAFADQFAGEPFEASADDTIASASVAESVDDPSVDEAVRASSDDAIAPASAAESVDDPSVDEPVHASADEAVVAASSPAEAPPASDAIVPVEHATAIAPLDATPSLEAAEPFASPEPIGAAAVDATDAALVDALPALDAEAAAAARRAAPTERESTVQDDIDPDLLDVFVEEGNEILPQVGELLRTWQAHRDNAAPSRMLLRHLHTLKGSARMAGAMRLGEVVHDFEARVESAARLHDVPATLMDELVASHDRSLELFDELQRPAAPAVATTVVEAPVEASLAPAVADTAPVVEVAATAAAPTPTRDAKQSTQHVVRVAAETLDRLVNLAGEVSISRARIENEVAQIKGAMTDLSENVERLRAQLREIELQAEFQMQSQMQSQQAAGEEREKFDPLEFDRFTRFQELTRMMAESVNDVKTVQQHLQKSLDAAEVDLTSQRRMTRDLQQDLMRVRMVPFSSIAERLYRVARRSAKEARQARQPRHPRRLGRNRPQRAGADGRARSSTCCATTSSTASRSRDERRARGKEETGELLVEVRQEGNEIVLTFSDDGAGLEPRPHPREGSRARA